VDVRGGVLQLPVQMKLEKKWNAISSLPLTSAEISRASKSRCAGHWLKSAVPNLSRKKQNAA
jgi:hypothetical protein